MATEPPRAGEVTSAPAADPGGSKTRIVCVSQVGPFDKVALVLMPLDQAVDLVGKTSDRPAFVLEGVARDLEAIRETDADLASGALAGVAIAMAFELENPYTSATAKANCANSLRDVLARLRELMPVDREADDLDELTDARNRRLEGRPTPSRRMRTG